MPLGRYLSRHTGVPAGVMVTYSPPPSDSFFVAASPARARAMKALTLRSLRRSVERADTAIPPAVGASRVRLARYPISTPTITWMLLDVSRFRWTLVPYDETNSGAISDAAGSCWTFKPVEAGRVELPSCIRSSATSTCVSRRLMFRAAGRQAAHDSMSPRRFRLAPEGAALS